MLEEFIKKEISELNTITVDYMEAHGWGRDRMLSWFSTNLISLMVSTDVKEDNFDKMKEKFIQLRDSWDGSTTPQKYESLRKSLS